MIGALEFKRRLVTVVQRADVPDIAAALGVRDAGCACVQRQCWHELDELLRTRAVPLTMNTVRSVFATSLVAKRNCAQGLPSTPVPDFVQRTVAELLPEDTLRADPNILVKAIEVDMFAFVDALVKHRGVDLSKRRIDGTPLLMWCLERADDRWVRFVLAKSGGMIPEPDKNGRTAFHVAAANNFEAICRALLTPRNLHLLCWRVTGGAHEGRTAEEIADVMRHREVARMLKNARLRPLGKSVPEDQRPRSAREHRQRQDVRVAMAAGNQAHSRVMTQ